MDPQCPSAEGRINKRGLFMYQNITDPVKKEWLKAKSINMGKS